jgi:polar amino acid transport system substrate-binding protein
MISRVRLVADLYPPYQFEEHGIIRGVDHDVIAESFKIQNIKAETTLHSWDECMSMMDSGKADGIFQITTTPERKARFLLSEQLRAASTLFFKRAGFSKDLDSNVDLASQLKGMKTGLLSGYSYDPAVDSLSDELKVATDSSESLLFGLRQGEFDLALMERGVAAYLMARLRIEEIDNIPGYEIQRQLYVAFQKDLTELASHFNTGLRKIKESGVYDEIFRKYGL